MRCASRPAMISQTRATLLVRSTAVVTRYRPSGLNDSTATLPTCFIPSIAGVNKRYDTPRAASCLRISSQSRSPVWFRRAITRSLVTSRISTVLSRSAAMPPFRTRAMNRPSGLNARARASAPCSRRWTLRAAASHHSSAWSSPIVARYAPREPNATDVAKSLYFWGKPSAVAAASHRRAVPSALAVARYRPSGLNVTERTVSPWTMRATSR